MVDEESPPPVEKPTITFDTTLKTKTQLDEEYSVKEQDTTSKVEASPPEYTVKEKPPETKSIEELENRLEDPDNERGEHSEVMNSLAKLRDTQMNTQKK